MFGSRFRRMIPLALMILIGAARAECQDWKTKWERILADAKKEGKVVVAGPPGTAYRDVTERFRKEISRDCARVFKVLLRQTLPRGFPTSARRDNIFGIST